MRGRLADSHLPRAVARSAVVVEAQARPADAGQGAAGGRQTRVRRGPSAWTNCRLRSDGTV
jgi:hypothetical protein